MKIKMELGSQITISSREATESLLKTSLDDDLKLCLPELFRRSLEEAATILPEDLVETTRGDVPGPKVILRYNLGKARYELEARKPRRITRVKVPTNATEIIENRETNDSRGLYFQYRGYEYKIRW